MEKPTITYQCPETREPLRPATAEESAAIQSFLRTSPPELPEDHPFAGELPEEFRLNTSRTRAYAERSGIPVLLPGAALRLNAPTVFPEL